jgi:2-haloacid dehalogenase
MDNSKIKYIVFDTFGTVMDWHSAIVEKGNQLSAKYDINIDWHVFANTWRTDGYIKTIIEVAKGLRPWERVDTIHKEKLLELIDRFQISMISDEDIEDLNLEWHRLLPWPDSVPGLRRLKEKYLIGPFSNGDFRLLLDMAEYSDLPWDFVISGDMFKKFKPDPSVYPDAISLLGGHPEEILMVAAHPHDLMCMSECGCPTALIRRPLEFGENSGHAEPELEYSPDLILKDFEELADMLLK